MDYPLKGRDLERWNAVQAAYQRLIDADDYDVCICWHYLCLDYGDEHVLPMSWLDEWCDEYEEDGRTAPAKCDGFDDGAAFFYYDESDGFFHSAEHLRDTPIDAGALTSDAFGSGPEYEIDEITALLEAE